MSQFNFVLFCLESRFIYCAEGPQGEIGFQGRQGNPGVQGPQGNPAPAGPAGRTGVPVIIPLSTPPANPLEGRVYLDDGTNTGDNNSGFRYYNGTGWIDL